MNTPKDILRRAKDIEIFAPLTLHYSYKLFLNFFQKKLSDDSIVQGAYMVYGWMPTMLRLKDSPQHIVDLAYSVRKKGATPEMISSCAKALNNSLVGTTKLMHFLSPEDYPIWDSRVYRALYSKTPHIYRVESVTAYINYVAWCKQFVQLPGFSKLQERFVAEAGYPVTSIRVAEAVLYALGERPKKLPA
jgi:hypothetical protein